MEEREDLESAFFYWNNQKDKRQRDSMFFDLMLDIRDLLMDNRNLLWEMNYVDDDGTCHCPECEKLREEVEDQKEQENIEVFEATDEIINELYEKENGKE